MSLRLLTRLYVLVITCSLAYGQMENSGSPSSAATISTSLRNVVLDVIVTDRLGKPI